jgi:hypothetical protein
VAAALIAVKGDASDDAVEALLKRYPAEDESTRRYVVNALPNSSDSQIARFEKRTVEVLSGEPSELIAFRGLLLVPRLSDQGALVVVVQRLERCTEGFRKVVNIAANRRGERFLDEVREALKRDGRPDLVPYVQKVPDR